MCSEAPVGNGTNVSGFFLLSRLSYIFDDIFLRREDSTWRRHLLAIRHYVGQMFDERTFRVIVSILLRCRNFSNETRGE